MSDLRLYDYQKRLLEIIVRAFKNGSRDVLLHAPCGAGKTLLGKAFAAWGLLAQRHDPEHVFKGFHTVVVCAPLDTIVEPWGADATVEYRREAAPLAYHATRLLDHKRGQSSLAFWRDFWARDFATAERGVFTCARALLTTTPCMQALAEAQARGGLLGFLLMADEAHHHAPGGNQSGQLVTTLLAGGGSLLGSTATPWSSVGEIIRDETAVVALTLSQYHGEADPDALVPGKPFAPRRWEALTIVTDYETDDETLMVEKGHRATEDDPDDETMPAGLRDFALSVVPCYVKRWVDDGCRKVVMRARTVAAAKALVQTLERSVKARRVLGHKPRVLDLSGHMSPVEKVKAQAVLASEASVRRYGDSTVDVIVAVVRMDEGTDWRPCSDVYTTGIPGSLGFDIQLSSRGARGKSRIAGYPAGSEDVHRTYYFLPRLDEDARGQVALRYTDTLLAKALLVESLETGLAVANIATRAPAGTGAKRSRRADDARFEREVDAAEHAAAWQGDSVAAAAAFAKVVKTLAKMGDNLTIAQVGEVVDRATEGLSERQRVDLIRGAMAHVAAKDATAREAWRKAEAKSARKGGGGEYRAANVIRAEVEEEWRRFVAGSGERVFPSLDDVLSRSAGYTGLDCSALVGLYKNSACTPEEWCVLLKAFHVEHGRWPSWTAKDSDERRLSSALIHNLRPRHPDALVRHGIPLVAAYYVDDYRNKQCIQIKLFHAEHKRWPSSTAKDPNERCLGYALSTLRRKYLDVLKRHDIPLVAPHRADDYQNRQCVEIKAFRVKYGRWPSSKSKDPDERRLGHALSSLRVNHPNVLVFHDIPLAIPRHALNYNDSLCKEVKTFRVEQGRWPLTTAKEHNERRLSRALCNLRRNHPDMLARHGIPLVAPHYADDYNDKQCVEIKTFHAEHGRWPSKSAKDPDERRLGKVLGNLRNRHPDVLARHDIPPQSTRRLT